MKKLLLLIVALFWISNSLSQNNLLWKSYTSYNNIKDISASSTNMFAAAENAIFSKNYTTNVTKNYTTVDGLSGETITKIFYSATFNKTLVGYQDGLIKVINNTDGTIFNAIGIVQKQIPTNIKKINNFYENNGIIYVSCDFGIVQFKLSNSEFGDTYFLGNTISDYQAVLQTTVFNNMIYAVTQYNGIKTGSLTNPNLNDFSQWTVFDSSAWNGIATINNVLVGSNTNNGLYKWTGNSNTPFYSMPQATTDFRVYDNKLIVTCPQKTVIFDASLTAIATVNNTTISTVNPVLTCATMVNNTIYIGTFEDGLFSASFSNPNVFTNISPDGPQRNTLFAINASTENLWAVYGGYSGNYNPYAYNNLGLNTYGISKLQSTGWKHIPYSSLFGAKALSKITVNPKNSNQVYISSMFSGLLKLENDVPTILYNQTNSALESLILTPPSPSYVDIRINGAVFDKSGNLWVVNSACDRGLKELKTDNTWVSYDLARIRTTPWADYHNNIVIDKNGTKWFPSYENGAIGYNENGDLMKRIGAGATLGNLPFNQVLIVAVDQKNQLWIGLKSGLRVLPSVDSFMSSAQMKSNAIIIIEEGLAQELLYEQFIKDIVVDGANRKWIGTADSGVFLFSSNGLETIYHFTKDNSPLPSNSILDIDINATTGEVFLATTKGMVSFKGVSTKANDNLESVYIYPNPVKPNFSGTVKISGLIDRANVKITDIEGNLVYETTSTGGTIEWDTTAFGKYKVASGVYMVFIVGDDGIETKVKKLMIIR